MQAGKENSTLKPIVLEEIMSGHRQKICDLISREKQHPQHHATLYDKYNNLISKQVRITVISRPRISYYFTILVVSMTISTFSFKLGSLGVEHRTVDIEVAGSSLTH